MFFLTNPNIKRSPMLVMNCLNIEIKYMFQYFIDPLFLI